VLKMKADRLAPGAWQVHQVQDRWRSGFPRAQRQMGRRSARAVYDDSGNFGDGK